MDPGMRQTLCPTDSRLRPDIRKLEMGDHDGAAAEKVRLEEKQRDSRKSKKHKKGTDPLPRFVIYGLSMDIVNLFTSLNLFFLLFEFIEILM